MTNLIKKSLLCLLYLFAIASCVLSLTYMQEKDLVFALVFISVASISYAFLTIKDFKFLSGLSYVTLILFLLCTMGGFGNNAGNGRFADAENEKIFYLSFGLSAFFVVMLCAHLITTQGWRRKLSTIFLILLIPFLLMMGMMPPDFHNNFVYTRVLVGIVFVLSILLIFKNKKRFRIGGIIGILGSIIALLMGALLFSAQIYVIEGAEREKVLNFVEPKVEEMLQFYNEKDFENFCKYCSEDLKLSFSQGLQGFQSLRDEGGQYVSYESPNTTRSKGFYYIEYPVEFENIADPLYFTVMLSDITPEDTIYGFNISPNQGE